MTAPTLIAADCGASRVLLARFSGDKDGTFRLDGVSLQSLGAVGEESWRDLTIEAVLNGLKEFGTTSKVQLVLPGSQCYGKFVKLARVEAAKLAKVVQFEAKQSIPYPLEEVAFGHVVVADDGVDLEVALAAAKLDVIEPLCRAIEKAGTEVTVVEPAFLAEINAARSLGLAAEGGKSVVILSIGARTTNVAVLDEGRFFARTLNLGGATVTQSIADELGLSFQDAEGLKLGLSRGELEAAEDSPELGAYSNAVRSFSSRLAMELTRTLATQKKQAGSDSVSALYLSGGGAQLQGLVDSFGERIRAPIGLLELGDAVQIGGAVDAAQLQAFQFQILGLVGLAARHFGTGIAGFNLLPARVAAENRFRKQQPFILAAAACLAGSLAFPIIGNTSRAEAFQRESQRVAEQIRQLEQLSRDISNDRNETDRIAGNITGIEELARSRSNWLSFFAELQERLYAVGDVWIERLEVTRPAVATAGAVAGAPAAYDPETPMIESQPVPEDVPVDSAIRLTLTGRLVDRANPLAKVSKEAEERVKRLLSNFADSEFIASVENERFDNSEKGILQFDFVLVVNPKKPL